jgi:Ser/Thr protein kinase RdoA (MazF antagonist)
VPEVDVDEMLLALAREAVLHWDLNVAELVLHSLSENAVFRVVTVAGNVFALRVHRPGYHDLAALESEQVWLRSLSDAGLSVPQGELTSDGSAYVELPLGPAGETRHVGLVPWLNGVTLGMSINDGSGAGELQASFETLGGLMAHFHLASIAWVPPAGFKRHSWDVDGLMGEQPFWGRFWEIDAASKFERSQLLAIRNQLAGRLGELSKRNDVYGMIHADMNCGNIIQDRSEVSVIDFDDAGFGWHAFDLAVAQWHSLDATASPEVNGLVNEALVKGYRSIRPECDEILAEVPMFVLVRTLMLLRWMQDRPELRYQSKIPELVQIALAQASELGLGEL